MSIDGLKKKEKSFNYQHRLYTHYMTCVLKHLFRYFAKIRKKTYVTTWHLDALYDKNYLVPSAKSKYVYQYVIYIGG